MFQFLNPFWAHRCPFSRKFVKNGRWGAKKDLGFIITRLPQVDPAENRTRLLMKLRRARPFHRLNTYKCSDFKFQKRASPHRDVIFVDFDVGGLVLESGIQN